MPEEGFTPIQARLEAGRCLQCDEAPCACDCPAGVDARAFIRKIRCDNLEGAVRMLRRCNVLSASCSYICPTGALCGRQCAAAGLLTPIDIRGLQRFVMDRELRQGLIEPIASLSDGPRVAVVGAGPAGLGCAAELAVRGHAVTVFERDAVAGGMLAQCIPSERLPREVVDLDVAFVRKLGVEIVYNHAVDDPHKLLAEGYRAVFLATGLSKHRSGGFVGESLPGVVQALDLLRAAKQGVLPELGKRAIVIGGGDTALDAARTVRRSGTECIVLYRRTQREMPAYPDEIDAAWDEGVEFYFRTIVHGVLGTDHAKGVRCVRVRWREKVPGMQQGYDVEGPEFQVAGDTVIVAIGQEPESSFGLRQTPNGLIAVDRATLATSAPGIFAGGDLVFGGGTAARAVGQGKQAAIAMDAYVSGTKG